MNSTLGSVVPLAMFVFEGGQLDSSRKPLHNHLDTPTSYPSLGPNYDSTLLQRPQHNSWFGTFGFWDFAMSDVSDNLLKAVRHLVASDHIIFKVTGGEKSYLGIRMFRSNSLKAFSKPLWPEKLFSEIYSNVSHGSSAQLLSDTWKIFIVFCQLA